MLNKLIPESVKRRLKTKLGVPSQEDSFARLKGLGFDPKVCLDIGAYEGNWTRDLKNIFPDMAVLMLEGQSEKEGALKKVKEQFTDVDYHIALLGAEERDVTFHKYETASSVLSEHHSTGARTETVKLRLLDKLVEKTRFEKSELIKIDTQGYELEILKGGEKALASAEFVLLEVSLLDIYKDVPLVAEVIAFMNQRRFVLYDICSLMRRPLDKALFQSDFLFAKENSIFRKDKRWS
ncbi:MAG TPA: FkbM family methyltransferase [Mucilaginibacter sp.]|jgi:FkbM family methyltransferase|nr:FkbM family methyltransferase [Mucilaginibacter sp.]